MKNLQKNNFIVLGVTGGIAGFKTVKLVEKLQKEGFFVDIILTEAASKMFGKKMFVRVTKGKIHTDIIEKNFDYKKVLEKREVGYIALAKKTSVLVVAPATANTISKLAGGIADNYLTTFSLAFGGMKIICPSMNTKMLENPAIRKNLDILKKRNFRILGPDSGDLACGTKGAGRMIDISKIFEEIKVLAKKQKLLAGKKIMVTAGPTSERIDPVRVITNKASGKMGKEIADVLSQMGAEVTLVRSESAAKASLIVKTKIFETGQDLKKIIKKTIKNYDVMFHTAAVSDFTPKKLSETKIDSSKDHVLHLERTTKILHKIRSWNPNILLVGFKAVYKKSKKEAIDIGAKKLIESSSDFMVVNDVGRKGIGFGADENEVNIIGKKGYICRIPKSSKENIALEIIKTIFNFQL